MLYNLSELLYYSHIGYLAEPSRDRRNRGQIFSILNRSL